MPGKAGTLEILAQQIALALGPLETQLKPDNILNFLAELGLRFPPQLLQPNVVAALNAGSNAAADLRAAVTQLNADITIDNQVGITANGGTVLQAIQTLSGSFTQLGTAIGGAVGLPGMNAAEVSAFAQNLPANLLAHSFITRLESRQPAVVGLASLFGVIEYTPVPAVPRDPTHPASVRRRLQLQNLGSVLGSPKDLLLSRFDWGAGGFDGTKLIPTLANTLTLIGLYARVADFGPPNTLNTGLLTLGAKSSPPRLDLQLHYDLPAGFNLTLPLTDVWSVQMEVRGVFAAGLQVSIAPPGTVTLTPASATNPEALQISLRAKGAQPIIILGQTGGSRLQVDSISLGVGLTVSPGAGTRPAELGILLALAGGKVIIDAGQADGFIAKLLSSLPLEGDFNVDLDFSLEHGLHFAGSSALEIQLASHTALGPIEIQALTLTVGLEDGKFPVGITTDLKADIGPLQAVVQGLGFSLDFALADGNTGNLGPLDLSASFVPPKGAGLSIDAGIVTGGGYLFFDADKEEYAGALELDITGLVTAKAIGLITTRMPDGSKGFSLLIIISAEFATGIQLGFGFTLLAVGGLLGVNRTMQLQPLMEGIRTGAVESLMFPKDVIANAPKIISDLRTFFPPAEDIFLIGPMAKLGWGRRP